MKKFIPFYFTDNNEVYPNPDWAFYMQETLGFPPELFLEEMKKYWEKATDIQKYNFKMAFVLAKKNNMIL